MYITFATDDGYVLAREHVRMPSRPSSALIDALIDALATTPELNAVSCDHCGDLLADPADWTNDAGHITCSRCARALAR